VNIYTQTLTLTQKCKNLNGDKLLTCWFGKRRHKQAAPFVRTERDALENPYANVKPSRKPRRKPERGKVTSKMLERIGEGLAKAIFAKHGIKLAKIPLIQGFYGYKSQDVDFVSEAARVKVEAKTWWVFKKSFPLARISDNERGYLDTSTRNGFKCYITIALLETELATRSACSVFYVIPWLEWLNIEDSLKTRQKGNFQGRSLRKCDLDLLEKFILRKVKGRWRV